MGRKLTSMFVMLAAVLGGCADDLPKATKIERMRVLGARLEVVGDEQRVTPRPGEDVRVTLPTVFPALERSVDDVQTMLIRCTTPTQFTGGLPICQEFLDAALGQDSADVAAAIDMDTRLVCGEFPLIAERQEFQGVALWCLGGQPQAELRIPEGIRSDALFLGVVCEDGAPFLDPSEPTLFGCDGDAEAEAILVNGQIPVLRGDDSVANHNPSLAPSELLMDLGPWPAWDPSEQELPPSDNCLGTARREDDDYLRVADIGDHEITIRYDADAREDDEEGEPESLEFTVFATDGEMERRFTLFNRFDDDELVDGFFEDSLEWDPGAADDVRSGGKIVRFFITLRDGRGGFDMATRVVCVKK
jgi:hypothetical protein